MKFAKLFESDKYGQICVVSKSDNDEGAPEVRVYFKLPDFDVCSVALVYQDTDEGWNRREKTFTDFSLEQGEAMIAKAIEEYFMPPQRS